MTPKRRRMMVLSLGLLGVGAATALALTAFQDNLVFFYSPSDVQAKSIPPERRFRLGGLVEENSLQRLPDNLTVQFRVTDLTAAMPVTYKGALPDLFREGQGVVAEGKLRPDGVFIASEVLARHDENYMPPEVAEALKKSGQWQPPAKTK